MNSNIIEWEIFAEVTQIDGNPTGLAECSVCGAVVRVQNETLAHHEQYHQLESASAELLATLVDVVQVLKIRTLGS